MALSANNIDEVLEILEEIVADTSARGDPRGCFPAVYRQMTRAVSLAIKGGVFDDGPRMDRMDTLFANRYFAAYDAAVAPTSAWRVAFDAIDEQPLIVLQNLLLGINAHINLDLAVVVGENFEGQALDDFHDDFDRINDILAALTPRIRAAIGSFSPLIALLDPIDAVDPVLDFSFDRARDTSWRWAQVLSRLDTASRPTAVGMLDHATASLGRLIARPDLLTAVAVQLIRNTESTDMRAIIKTLDAV